MDSRDIAKTFRDMARLLEVEGANPFRVRAYQRAADALEELGPDLPRVVEAGGLTEIPGIGRDLAAKVREALETGRIREYDELARRVPAGLLQVLAVPGVGPRKARLFFDRLGVASLEALEAAAREGRLRELPGVGARTEERILKGIALVRAGMARRPIGTVMPVARALAGALRAVPGVHRVTVAGSLRRCRETVKDVDLLAEAEAPEAVSAALARLPGVAEVLLSGPTRTSIRLEDGLQVDLRFVPRASYGAALCYFTGSQAHNVRLRELAVRKGLKVNEYGVSRAGVTLGGEREEDVYAALGLDWIPPELREDRGEIEAAQAHRLPRLVTPADIRGDGHVHSRYSDGAATLEEIRAAAAARGLEWVIVCDHSRSLRIAGGLSEERLREKTAEIRRLNRSRSPGDPVLFCGVEVEILPDGGLDYPDPVLDEVDWVLAAVHTGFGQDRARVTDRMIAAVSHPRVHCLAHPSGRLLGERDPMPYDAPAVFEAAARHGTALEINASWRRLDLDDLQARAAAAAGCRLMLGTDAHALEQMDQMEWGVGIARRAWLGPDQCLNTLSAEALEAWAARKGKGA
ncbi:DNA polymerase/3'-5' exonuclease PolX [Dissulfurirhabdus thermomarina]|uniref:DNA polymerase beta n=1 Tax=Dissulfurirhabdus thermomarina TaxID=1765737 RepID=A0A6N9TQI9_DISTH|nr:DNA polymerase/3'-5' exonuclease PolX [Dissulfurirhabdus thermomarina]NDY42373.1 DNA polymerase/3'-5' exonuclease PolX [Dissulfurirhabdus thermomarina]NMX23489.1 DNA polymerase/3'-5' exonuclease PolX [Dissulfurirhabdus thermomarina]